tara:strand:+ start:1313 stop:1909 length:597 start_codon:yes stop_codon:yes gene_type:complete
MTIEKTATMDNFIGVYDNYITKDECDKAVTLFENQHKFRNTVDRMHFENKPITVIQDQQFFGEGNNIDVWWEELKPLIYNFDLAWQHYKKHTGAASVYQEKFFYTALKIQKTLPTQGYHVWHLEHGLGFDNECRAFVYIIYLNDVEEGGETEFLHFSKRIKPKKGRIVIWPAGFPYVHRGNSPLLGEKYILTSWLRLR